MTSTVKTVTRNTTMHELQRMYDEDDFNCYPVRENGRPGEQIRLSEMLCVHPRPDCAPPMMTCGPERLLMS